MTSDGLRPGSWVPRLAVMAALDVDKDEGRLGEERPGGNPLSFPQTFVKEQQVGAGAEVDKGERNLPRKRGRTQEAF